ncbi:5-(carboxyamino)imidazole ribonucleotide synthase [Spirochaeta africana]|uniref:N5-carboxyaminoimidazole ribonucleotide synthase n=1 Tax=Spirochaeta africana (strain ATCC 700263 / DSM 8902 / Z-7692) TaxID=889378 RepID=H9UGD7_SPIAZ|nr:5-(carboxyamino)imidazole ribonucleotide synthase [Spirochaeta africana]AFG36580.1 phosphoribosylaminoimidazole carboxylase (NCAIR synthetase) [Spirochaeta africana DSM 8902]
MSVNQNGSTGAGNSSAYRPGKTLGIVGGGQLGRMLLPEARRLGLRVAVYSGSPDDPAVGGADVFVQGSLTDADGIAAFARECDYLTIEIEHVSLAGLQRAEEAGCRVFPPSSALATVQDKLAQRRCFEGLPQPRFAELPDFRPDDEPAWRAEVLSRAQEFGFPVVQKTRRGGYDGRGVAVLRSPEDVTDTDGRLLCADSYLEDFVALRMELGVLVARSAAGAGAGVAGAGGDGTGAAMEAATDEAAGAGADGASAAGAAPAAIAAFPVTEMLFDPELNICTSVAFPARIDAAVAARAVSIARSAAARLGVTGLLAVELFIDQDGEVLLNEVAPRPHNSGHGTIEGVPTSQYGQHLRAGLGLPLGAVEPVIPTVMNNLLGADGAEGTPVITGLAELLAIPGTALHWYGKPQVRPGRKMGHVTVTAGRLEQALERAGQAAELIRIEGE